jgi:hypothetical protein
MKRALAKTPKHDFVFPGGEVSKVRLCGTGKVEVFLTGTEPHDLCTLPLTPATKPSAGPGEQLRAAPAVPLAPVAVPATPATDSVGDGTHSVPIGPADATPPP